MGNRLTINPANRKWIDIGPFSHMIQMESQKTWSGKFLQDLQ
jgi:hypothetical protein